MNLNNNTSDHVKLTGLPDGDKDMEQNSSQSLGSLDSLAVSVNGETTAIEVVLKRFLGGGPGDDTGVDPSSLTGGGDQPGSRQGSEMLLRNTTDAPLRVLVEKSIPAGKAFRLLDQPGTLTLRDDDGLTIVLAAE